MRCRRGYQTPKGKSAETQRKREITKEQALEFVHKLKNEPQDGRIVAVWLGLATGLRRGEALALVWEDVDLENARLRIRKQYGKEKVLKDPKTAKSRRTISIDNQTVESLRSGRPSKQGYLQKWGLLCRNPRQYAVMICAFSSILTTSADGGGNSMLKRAGTLRARINLYRSSRNRTSEAVGIHRPELSGIAKSSSHAAGGGGSGSQDCAGALGARELEHNAEYLCRRSGRE